jgi:hypothetical protein
MFPSAIIAVFWLMEGRALRDRRSFATITTVIRTRRARTSILRELNKKVLKYVI